MLLALTCCPCPKTPSWTHLAKAWWPRFVLEHPDSEAADQYWLEGRPVMLPSSLIWLHDSSVGVIVDSSKKGCPSVFVRKWNVIQEPFCGNHKWNLVRKFFVSGKFWNDLDAKSAMRLDVPATWNIVSSDAWHDNICSASIQRSCAACFALRQVILMPMPLLVCCHTSMQHGCVPDWQNVQGPSIVKVGPAFPGLSLKLFLFGCQMTLCHLVCAVGRQYTRQWG